MVAEPKREFTRVHAYTNGNDKPDLAREICSIPRFDDRVENGVLLDGILERY
jgi:hypothetical protein